MKHPSTLHRIESLCVTPACGIRRSDILTADAMRGAICDRIGGVIVHRINFPKTLAGKASEPRKAAKVRNVTLAKETPFADALTVRATVHRKACPSDKVRPMLSETEVADAKQTTALALIATGALERMAHGGRMTLGDWKVAFRAVRGADCLRIDRKAKNQSEVVSISSLTPEAANFIAATQGFPTLPQARRDAIAREVRYLRACFFARFKADASRKRANSYRNANRFLRFTLSQYKATGAWGHAEVSNGNSPQSFRMAHDTWRKYRDAGEAILTAESLAFIPAKKDRTLRAFADIPENFAIAD
ncbi:MAG: hypothetical protein QOE70_390 [Chthoniobacter sp.]|jgi:hypothetical protein|nr:hypothetical protein [Chthoniobacter sp.]